MRLLVKPWRDSDNSDPAEVTFCLDEDRRLEILVQGRTIVVDVRDTALLRHMLNAPANAE